MAVHARPVAIMHQMMTQHPARYTVPHNAGRGLLSSRREDGSFFGGIVAPPPCASRTAPSPPRLATPPRKYSQIVPSFPERAPAPWQAGSQQQDRANGRLTKGLCGPGAFLPTTTLSLPRFFSARVCREAAGRAERRELPGKAQETGSEAQEPAPMGPPTGWRAAHKRDQA